MNQALVPRSWPSGLRSSPKCHQTDVAIPRAFRFATFLCQAGYAPRPRRPHMVLISLPRLRCRSACRHNDLQCPLATSPPILARSVAATPSLTRGELRGSLPFYITHKTPVRIVSPSGRRSMRRQPHSRWSGVGGLRPLSPCSSSSLPRLLVSLFVSWPLVIRLVQLRATCAWLGRSPLC